MKPKQPSIAGLAGLLLALVTQSALAFYDPAEQRWINRDPIGEVGGANLHGFVRNRPVDLRDPQGLAAALDLCCGYRVGVAASAPALAFFTGAGADAARHCYVGCQIAALCNQATATAIGVLHEIHQQLTGSGYPSSADYFNTRIGAEVCGLTKNCRDCCKELWKSGELIVEPR